MKTVIGDGEGGWFIGGQFVAVAGEARRNLAHILADGRVAAWNPDADGPVFALARRDRRVYVGGSFTAVGGAARANLAAVDAATGGVLDWRPDADASVRALLVAGEVLYAGGDFSSVGGESRNSLAALDTSSAAASAWNPDVGFDGAPGKVRALALAGGTVLVGGDFITVGGVLRSRLAAVDETTGVATSWDPDVSAPIDPIYGDPVVYAIAVDGDEVFVGGHFAQVGAVTRSGFVQLDRATGAVAGWNPVALTSGPDITALTIADSTLYLAGGFVAIAGEARRYCAAIDLRTHIPTSFNPRTDMPVEALGVSASTVFVAGRFSSVGSQWRNRRGLAAFDLATGAVKEWNPDPNALFVSALAVVHDKLYVGGSFSMIGGRVRYGLAAVDTLTGAASDWDPVANSAVAAFAVSGDTLYAGGYFSTMGGQPRGRLASFDLTTGELTGWNPNADPDVYGLTVDRGVIYASGFFWRIGGLTRKGLAAVDAVTGEILPWDPQSDNWCYATTVHGDTVLVAGYFSSIGGRPNRNLAALDRATGQSLSWTAEANDAVLNFATLQDTLFVGGTFTVIGGKRRNGLAALDLRSGSVLDWDPDLSSDEWWGAGTGAGASTLAVSGNTLYAGGGFWRTGGIPTGCLAAISFGPPPRPPAEVAERLLMSLGPNPTRSLATISFSQPSSGPLTLDVFDVQGRRVASLLDHAMRPAGPGKTTLRADGWREGVYFCRLASGAALVTKKLIVVR